MPLSTILLFGNKNKELFALAKDFYKNLKPFSISGLTKHIEKIIVNDSLTLKRLKITHIWIFSHRKLSMFIHFSSLFSTRILSFEIIKFVLKKEFFNANTVSNKNFANIFLFLNNISDNSELGIILNKHLRKIVPIKKNEEIILKGSSRCILFDFDDTLETMEYRCYSLNNNNLLLPRKIRKIKKLKKLYKGYGNDIITPSILSNVDSTSVKVYKNRIKNIVRITEIGPRISTKIFR